MQVGYLKVHTIAQQALNISYCCGCHPPPVAKKTLNGSYSVRISEYI